MSLTMRDGSGASPPQRPTLSRIVHAFPTPLLRAYCRIRLLIIGPRILDVIADALPESGELLDIGSGYGLAALYFADLRRGVSIRGYDFNAARVTTANAAALALGRENVHFAVGDAARLTFDRGFDGAYAIDLIHHVPRAAVGTFLDAVYDRLKPGGCFVVKDVDNVPSYKRFVSWLTDRVMCGFDEEIYYWPVSELRGALEKAGFIVQSKLLPDWLPYPHVLYVCRRPLSA
jgi:SAM-dependent methyltransferase